jgi:FkbM family methyltransferase
MYAFAAIARRWKYLREYDGIGSWLLSHYDSLVRRFRTMPMPGRDSVRRVWLKAYNHPFYVRLGRADGFIFEEVFLNRAYHTLFQADLGEVHQVLDLGSNAGLTVRLWQLKFPGARVIAVEPEPGNCDVCRLNAKETGDNVRVVQACVGLTERQAYLDMDHSECMLQMVDQPLPGSIPVPVKTVPAILAEHGIDGPVDLLKCDIEGAEAELFSDCSAWIGRVRNIVIEVHSPYTVEALLGDLARAGASYVSQPCGGHVYFLQRSPAAPAAA